MPWRQAQRPLTRLDDAGDDDALRAGRDRPDVEAVCLRKVVQWTDQAAAPSFGVRPCERGIGSIKRPPVCDDEVLHAIELDPTPLEYDAYASAMTTSPARTVTAVSVTGAEKTRTASLEAKRMADAPAEGDLGCPMRRGRSANSLRNYFPARARTTVPPPCLTVTTWLAAPPGNASRSPPGHAISMRS